MLRVCAFIFAMFVAMDGFLLRRVHKTYGSQCLSDVQGHYSRDGGLDPAVNTEVSPLS